MLVLSRKPNESICIGDNIKITITEVGRNRVRVGIEAPDDVIIKRGELKDRPDASVDDAPGEEPKTSPSSAA